MEVALPQTRKLRFGFTLVEVAVAVAITGLAIMALYSGLSYCFAMVQLSRETERATQIMLDQMERVRLLTFSQIQDQNYCPPKYTEYYYPDGAKDGAGGVEYSVNLMVEPVPDEMIPASADYRDDLRLITIRVHWNSGETARVREMRTLAARNGLQRYVLKR